jgi:hypothetical protein
LLSPLKYIALSSSSFEWSSLDSCGHSDMSPNGMNRNGDSWFQWCRANGRGSELVDDNGKLVNNWQRIDNFDPSVDGVDVSIAKQSFDGMSISISVCENHNQLKPYKTFQSGNDEI